MFYVVFFVFWVGLLVIFPGAGESVDTDSAGFDLFDRLASMALYGLYMGAVEALFGGKSLGKLITKTRAVNDDGTRISTGTAFLRGLSRAVPFSAFSALGTPCYPWHDRWTHTLVIDEKASVICT